MQTSSQLMLSSLHSPCKHLIFLCLYNNMENRFLAGNRCTMIHCKHYFRYRLCNRILHTEGNSTDNLIIIGNCCMTSHSSNHVCNGSRSAKENRSHCCQCNPKHHDYFLTDSKSILKHIYKACYGHRNSRNDSRKPCKSLNHRYFFSCHRRNTFIYTFPISFNRSVIAEDNFFADASITSFTSSNGCFISPANSVHSSPPNLLAIFFTPTANPNSQLHHQLLLQLQSNRYY